MKRTFALAAFVGAVAAIVVLVAVQIAGARGPKHADGASSCHLGNGVQHVINLVFDNVHFSRDNPNVPSDLEQMPHLLDFLKQ